MIPNAEYQNLPLGASVPVYLAAADWLILMSYFNSHDTDGINYLIYGPVMEQLTAQLYTAASIKAAQAKQADQQSQHPVVQMLGGIFGGQMPGQLRPEDFGGDNDGPDAGDTTG